MSELSTCPDCDQPWGMNVHNGCEGCEEFVFGVTCSQLADEAERGYDPDKMTPRRISDDQR